MPAKLLASGGICEPTKPNQPVSMIDWTNAMSPRTPSTRPSLMNVCASAVMLSSSDGTFGALPWTELYQRASWFGAEQVRPHDRRVRRNRRARRGGRQGGRRDGDSQRRARRCASAARNTSGRRANRRVISRSPSVANHRSGFGLLETSPDASQPAARRLDNQTSPKGAHRDEPALRAGPSHGRRAFALLSRRESRAPVPWRAGSRACRWGGAEPRRRGSTSRGTL